MLVKRLIILFLISVSATQAQTDFQIRLAQAAVSLSQDQVTYNGAYFSIDYPMGDVPEEYGVCTDVVIRSYRKVGIDLQQLVHEDMKAHFNSYPNVWGLHKTDSNIDHRRVPNLKKFFERQQSSLPITKVADNYQPGDVVSWLLDNNLTHIGIVTDRKAASGRYLIMHNIGAGQVLEDCLFKYTITGHYRYGK